MSGSPSEPIKICIAGATGWTGSALTLAVLASSTFRLTGVIARATAGQDIGLVLNQKPIGILIEEDMNSLSSRGTDVLIDFTSETSVKQRTIQALEKGLRVVIGSSGLTAKDFADIHQAAQMNGVGVIAAGNFSLTAALAKHFSLFAARYIGQWEIVDYASASKRDAPSGTTRELAEEMANIASNHIEIPLELTHGVKESRGAKIDGTPVHSVRLPGYVIAFETHFGLQDERLTIRHDAGAGAQPYVAGTLLAAAEVMKTVGLTRGLDRLLFKPAVDL